MSSAQGYGWLRESAESRSMLHARAIPFRLSREFSAPAEIDHRGWRANHIEDQGQLGSCVGHGSSSAAEVLTFIDTKGAEQDKYNRMAAYVWAQMEDQLEGRDQGAMVSGALKMAKSKGFALESLWPYSGRYTTAVPRELLEDARQRLLIGQHAIPRNYQQAFDGLASGVFVCILGTPWYESFAQNDGLIERIAGRQLGGHCYLIHGYSKRKDARGRNYLIVENSHGKVWGRGGFAEMAPGVFERLVAGISRGNEILLWTDIATAEPEPRPFDWMNDWPNM